MTKKRWIRAGGTALVVVIAAVVVIAMSGGSSTAGSAGSASEGDQFAQFQECLSQQGVQMPMPGQGAPPAGSSSGASATEPPKVNRKTQAAMQACSQYAPSGGPGGTPPTGAPPAGTPPIGTPPTGAPTTQAPQS